MKKFLTIILTAIMSLACVLTCVACNPSGWDGKVTIVSQGEAEFQGGFIVSMSDDVIYFINGVGNATADNTFGTPVKGSLVAAKKSDLTQTSIVVPKLLVAKDYSAGVYIYNGYAYYASPSTDLTSSGAIASSELKFSRTKLDASNTEDFFSTSSISASYRIIESDGVVYIVYYDEENTQLVSYNTSTKQSVVIAKTSDEVERETLKEYKFIDNSFTDDAVVVYTTTIYEDDFDADAKETQGDNYSRSQKSANNVYIYSVGDGVCQDCSDCYGIRAIKGDGEGVFFNGYELTYTFKDYIVYAETPGSGLVSTKTYIDTISNFIDGTTKTERKEVAKSGYAVSTNILVEDDLVFVNENGKIIKSTLSGDVKTEEQVAYADNIGTLLIRNGDYIYYIDSLNYLSRIKIANRETEADKTSQTVSEEKIANPWFKPVVIGNNIFYADASDNGGGYIYYTDITSEVKSKTVDDVTTYYLEGSKAVGIFTNEDIVSMAEAKVNAVYNGLKEGVIVLDTNDDGELVLEDGKPTVKLIDNAVKAYEDLSDANKKLYDSDILTNLKNYKEALRLTKVLYALKDFDTLSKTEKDSLKDVYESVKAEMDALKNSSTYTESVIRAMIPNNYNFFYQEATEYFTAE